MMPITSAVRLQKSPEVPLERSGTTNRVLVKLPCPDCARGILAGVESISSISLGLSEMTTGIRKPRK